MLTTCIEHKFLALNNITREQWEHGSADRRIWSRDPQLTSNVADNGIDPIEQHMEPLDHRLMATLGAT